MPLPPVRRNPDFTATYEQQKQITVRALQDRQVRTDLVVAVVGGVLSSAALARAYGRLTAEGGKSDVSQILKAAGIAVATGSLSVLYKLYTAGKTQGTPETGA
jgi:hypothetical protein